MKRSADFILKVLALGVALGLAGSLPAVGKDKTKKGKANSSAGSPSPPKFNIPIPVGHSAEGVNLPYFDDRGRLQMYYSIREATRTDENHLDMEMANIQTYDEKQNPETNILLKRSTLDLNTRIVTSQVPVTIQRADLELTGDKMNFNTSTRKGQLVGHVRMVIYNRQESKQAETATPAASPSPRPAAAAAAP